MVAMLMPRKSNREKAWWLFDPNMLNTSNLKNLLFYLSGLSLDVLEAEIAGVWASDGGNNFLMTGGE